MATPKIRNLARRTVPLLFVAALIAGPQPSLGDTIHGTCDETFVNTEYSCLFPFAGPDLHVIGWADTYGPSRIVVSIRLPDGTWLIYCQNSDDARPSCEARTLWTFNRPPVVRVPVGTLLTCSVQVQQPYAYVRDGWFGCGSRTL